MAIDKDFWRYWRERQIDKIKELLTGIQKFFVVTGDILRFVFKIIGIIVFAEYLDSQIVLEADQYDGQYTTIWFFIIFIWAWYSWEFHGKRDNKYWRLERKTYEEEDEAIEMALGEINELCEKNNIDCSQIIKNYKEKREIIKRNRKWWSDQHSYTYFD